MQRYILYNKYNHRIANITLFSYNNVNSLINIFIK